MNRRGDLKVTITHTWLIGICFSILISNSKISQVIANTVQVDTAALMKAYDDDIRSNPSDWKAYENRAWLLSGLGQNDKA
ncbi:MAG: hypothetical protein K2X81_16560, partial [Candidatus Obscuribacterales bacterium]|nr:hypothetical protein [Candidatus Obscuribacterales bacterium]